MEQAQSFALDTIEPKPFSDKPGYTPIATVSDRLKSYASHNLSKALA
jgi:hypothetical protein